MKPYWEKSIFIPESVYRSKLVRFEIGMGMTGPILTMQIDDAHIVIASKWKQYTSDDGAKQILEAIAEGLTALRRTGGDK